MLVKLPSHELNSEAFFFGQGEVSHQLSVGVTLDTLTSFSTSMDQGHLK